MVLLVVFFLRRRQISLKELEQDTIESNLEDSNQVRADSENKIS